MQKYFILELKKVFNLILGRAYSYTIRQIGVRILPPIFLHHHAFLK